MTFFKQNDIKSIKLENDKLIITYNNSTTETEEIDEPAKQSLKSFIEKTGKKELTLSDLEQMGNSSKSPNSNKGLYIGLAIGGGGVLVIGIIIYFLLKNKQEK